jgi:hypothetical protein
MRYRCLICLKCTKKEMNYHVVVVVFDTVKKTLKILTTTTMLRVLDISKIMIYNIEKD